MTGDEHQPQQIVSDVVVHRLIEPWNRPLERLDLVAKLCVLAFEQLAATKPVNRATLGRRHQPCPRVPRNAVDWPLFEGSHERILRQVLGVTNVSHEAGEPGDQPGRLDAPYRLDGWKSFGGRHALRSHHSGGRGAS